MKSLHKNKICKKGQFDETIHGLLQRLKSTFFEIFSNGALILAFDANSALSRYLTKCLHFFTDFRTLFYHSDLQYSEDIPFQASTLIHICPYKGKLKEGRKSCQNGTFIHCLAPNSELIFDLNKLARNLDNDMNVIIIAL